MDLHLKTAMATGTMQMELLKITAGITMMKIGNGTKGQVIIDKQDITMEVIIMIIFSLISRISSMKKMTTQMMTLSIKSF